MAGGRARSCRAPTGRATASVAGGGEDKGIRQAWGASSVGNEAEEGDGGRNCGRHRVSEERLWRMRSTTGSGQEDGAGIDPVHGV